MNFEYDPVKSATNKIKHGIDFDKAQFLWHDQNRVEIETYSTTEARIMVIGKIEDKHCQPLLPIEAKLYELFLLDVHEKMR